MMNQRVSTGVHGLDDVLGGGLPGGSTIILEGIPGSGKTTLGFQFLYQGVKVHGESGIYVTFEELPEQLYIDMSYFGWDLRQLEKNNQLRVVCVSPETMMDQMLEPDGLFDQMIDEIGCKRIVIDSVTLFGYGMQVEDERRKLIYQLRSILRRKGLTALLIREQSDMGPQQIPFEHFVLDGVIRLSVKPQLERYRERILEVMKLRGCNYLEGEHVYRITGEGIHLIPIPASHIHTCTTSNRTKNYLRTDIPHFDEMLGGGIPQGHVFMFNTDSRSDCRDLFGSIIAVQLKEEQKVAVLSSGLSTLYDYDHLYRVHGINAKEMIDQKRLYFVEHYDRPCPPSFERGILSVSKMNDDQFKHAMNDLLYDADGKDNGSWFVYYDLNTLISERGMDFVTNYFVREATNARTHGVTLMAVCNFDEMNESTISFLQRASDGVIRTWVHDTYQYLQVVKLPGGHISDIRILEHIPHTPYVRLV